MASLVDIIIIDSSHLDIYLGDNLRKVHPLCQNTPILFRRVHSVKIWRSIVRMHAPLTHVFLLSWNEWEGGEVEGRRRQGERRREGKGEREYERS